MHSSGNFERWFFLTDMLKDRTALAHVIQHYAKHNQLTRGKQLHTRLVCAGYQPCTFITNHLLNMYAKCGDIQHAVNLFDKMPQRNVFSWTNMISGFSQNGLFTEAIRTFSLMRVSGEKPTQFAFSSVIQASASLGLVSIGKQLHSCSLKWGLNCELFVGSNLADMYSKCGFLLDACRVFDEMPYKDEVSWTAMIDGYSKNGDFEEALLAFKRMVGEGTNVDQHVLCSTLGACAAVNGSSLGKCVHSYVVKLGFKSEVYVCNVLTDMYSKVGDMESASCVFGISSECMNVISYTSLIDGYAEKDEIDKALNVFLELRRQGVEPNEFTFSSLIKACANKAALEQGAQLHAQVIKMCFDKDNFVSSILVDMYGKCGLLDDSVNVFDDIVSPTEIAWNSLVGVYAQHGSGKEAIRIFNQMVHAGVKLNDITFVNLLIGCSHNGLVEEGLNYFNSMATVYRVEPKQEHYSCVIDLLGRAGRLKEAHEFIEKMPFEPNAFGWCSFLGACKTRGDKERAELAAEKLLQLEPENSGTHVLLSSIYASTGQWEEVRSIRKTMRDSKMKKLPGYSWVDIGNKTHIFGAEDWCHPQMKEIYEKLETLLDQIRKVGYVPQTETVPLEVEESVKERLLYHHSEKIAIAYALMNMPVGKPIIVKKNLRVCLDCHSAIKLISKVAERKIIVRDSNRFHHFMDGLCSCGDYW